jgi:2-amino-4-hydroxy-6-hydroxymethyldihydropteridine diphosphokinase
MRERDGQPQMAATHQIYLGLGSNLGDRRANLLWALDALRAWVAVERVSSLYDTAPLLVTDQPRFFNIACAGHTALAPFSLLRTLKAIERAAGRVGGPRYGPRPLDIDILLYDELVLSSPELTIPHPGLATRAFVLEPLTEIAPDLHHPALGLPIAVLLTGVDRAGVERLGPL